MALTPEQHEKLVAELRDDPERVGYAGKSESQAFALLHEPRTAVTETQTGVRLAAGAVLKTLGMTKGRAFLTAVTKAMPGMVLPYFGAGHELTVQELQEFKAALNGYPGIDPTDLAAVEAAAAPIVQRSQALSWPRVGRAFVGVAGMPNAIDPVDFAQAWTEVFGG